MYNGVYLKVSTNRGAILNYKWGDRGLFPMGLPITYDWINFKNAVTQLVRVN